MLDSDDEQQRIDIPELAAAAAYRAAGYAAAHADDSEAEDDDEEDEPDSDNEEAAAAGGSATRRHIYNAGLLPAAVLCVTYSLILALNQPWTLQQGVVLDTNSCVSSGALSNRSNAQPCWVAALLLSLDV